MNPCRPYTITFLTKLGRKEVERHESLADARLKASALGWSIEATDYDDTHLHHWRERDGASRIGFERQVECSICYQEAWQNCRNNQVRDA